MNAIVKPVDTLGRWYAHITQITQPQISKEDKIVFDRNGAIRLNYENKQVQEQINQHIRMFSKIAPRTRGA